jgi:carboxymethylenebutenolidase
MCHSDESRPPRPPVEGVVADRYDLRLTASDGAAFMAYAAVPQEPTRRSVVILPDVRGLHAFYKGLAALFAEAGYRAIAIDYFGRTADTDDRSETFDHMSHVEKMTPEALALDVRAAVDRLREADGTAAIFTVGFCFGGAYSWRQSAEGHGLAGAIGFYGGRPLARVGPAISRMRAPLLMLLAGGTAQVPRSSPTSPSVCAPKASRSSRIPTRTHRTASLTGRSPTIRRLAPTPGCGFSSSPRGCPCIPIEAALHGRKESLPSAVFVSGGRHSGSMIRPTKWRASLGELCGGGTPLSG